MSCPATDRDDEGPPLLAGMSALGRLSEPTRPQLADFHRQKRSVHRMLRQLDHDSREAMKQAPAPAS